MTMRRPYRVAAAGLIAVSVAASAQAPRLDLVDRLPAGSWLLHEIGEAGADRALCIRDPGTLLQIHHPGASCARFVIAATAQSATVHYTCPGLGHGRTTLTLDVPPPGVPARVRIHTQGLAKGAPFDVDYAARYDGACGPSARN
jgi:hypothetical protein